MDEKEQAKLKHEKMKKGLKIGGFVLLGLGAVFAIIGFIDFFSVFNSMSGMPRLFWCLFIGLPMLGVGAMLLSLGYKREVLSYGAKEVIPVINEVTEDIKPAVKNVTEAIGGAVGSVVRGVKDGLDGSGKACPNCGKVYKKAHKFCPNCGYNYVKVCSGCGQEVTGEDKFCANCGKKLD